MVNSLNLYKSFYFYKYYCKKYVSILVDNTEIHICDFGREDPPKCTGKKVLLKNLDDIDQCFIQWRAGLPSSEYFQDSKICQYHETLLLAQYSKGFKFCCEPYDCHKKRDDHRFSVISLKLAQDVKNSNLRINMY